ncbi:MAG: MOSC domain-containing protein [Oscillospiraceae bacterium]|nr:MOSC domain-containing protein [Oscillospiraceae bacterium]
MAQVVSVNLSEQKGTQKRPVPVGILRADYGLVGDAHAEAGPRQVSLLAEESIETLELPDLAPGAFGENIITRGICLYDLPVGTKLRIGLALCEVTQVGKVCHDMGCAIRRVAGDCVMPREGVFVRVLIGGPIRAGDAIFVEA